MSSKTPLPNTPTYNMAQIFLHWAIAVLIIANYFISDGMGHMLRQHIEDSASTPNWVGDFHIYVGLAILGLMVVRVFVRLFSKTPEQKTTGNGTLDKISHWVHIALYWLMFLVPAFGAASWYLKIHVLGDIHQITMNIMMSLILLHALAALFHQYVLKDGLLLRMLGRS
ncbi:cytochrome b [Marinomonas spartinae]|uniref:cytochrome b n=1 Tax=Marinomonas spartinae TaxID=1792290 RepID=UPI0018F21F9B|nr:cytochrome b/b6 domain-containing protein [Marinomonas spartinae]MBJ7553626.1 cytochrome b/b6 domain-containing protein [Marinomonas spartinae]